MLKNSYFFCSLGLYPKEITMFEHEWVMICSLVIKFLYCVQIKSTLPYSTDARSTAFCHVQSLHDIISNDLKVHSSCYHIHIFQAEHILAMKFPLSMKTFELGLSLMIPIYLSNRTYLSCEISLELWKLLSKAYP